MSKHCCKGNFGNYHNIKRVLLLLLLFAVSAMFCMAQHAGRIAILPFTGASLDEGDGIAELLSYTRQMADAFTIIPRTTITNAMLAEQNFQYSGMTDADTMVELGNQFGADYVMSGIITSLGSSNLLIVSIIKIDIIKQVAGAYITYRSLEDFVNNDTILENLAEEIITMMDNDSQNSHKLAVVPVQFASDMNKQEGDALAQLLSIFLIQDGTYDVYPRTQTLEQVQREYNNQWSGRTREDEQVELGRGENPQYVLSIRSRRIGTADTFNASIIELEGGNQIIGTSQPYSSLNDGIHAMKLLSRRLSGTAESGEERAAREREERALEKQMAASAAARAKAEAAAEAAAKREAAGDSFLKKSGINISGWFGISMNLADTKNAGDEADMPFSGGGMLELRLFSWFGLQTGFSVIQKTVPSDIQFMPDTIVTTLQVPVLAKINISFLGALLFSAYGGLGLNLSSSTNEGDIEDFPATSLILGLEGGMRHNNLNTMMGFQYNHDFGDPIRENTLLLYFGVGWYIPFRK